jgi:hypothetical protein
MDSATRLPGHSTEGTAAAAELAGLEATLPSGSVGRPQPNYRLQATGNSLRSCLAAAAPRA